MLARTRATYDDLCALPNHLVGEIVDGELIASPRPALLHAMVASGLGAELVVPFQRGRGGPGGWVILGEPEIHIAGQVLVPDMGGWRRERLPQVPDAPYLDLAPDWVCEILSPSTAMLDRTRKTRHYAAWGVKHVWLIDPAIQTLEVLRLDGETYRLVAAHAGVEQVRAEPFDVIELNLGELWAR